ncbi:hypothetical protein BU16DRAFT_618807 [Lophium mytilinum]|uniref:Uncharacterized protein n=1 Tax=Lophium mytilinum TaxID=390894 RepID=A0A6A6QR09_9PEZI|nr:hypothetical protein BU16DRAFT_618807 [Lophium mytilinum]
MKGFFQKAKDQVASLLQKDPKVPPPVPATRPSIFGDGTQKDLKIPPPKSIHTLPSTNQMDPPSPSEDADDTIEVNRDSLEMFGELAAGEWLSESPDGDNGSRQEQVEAILSEALERIQQRIPDGTMFSVPDLVQEIRDAMGEIESDREDEEHIRDLEQQLEASKQRYRYLKFMHDWDEEDIPKAKEAVVKAKKDYDAAQELFLEEERKEPHGEKTLAAKKECYAAYDRWMEGREKVAKLEEELEEARKW